VVLFGGAIGIGFYVLLFFALWKFYQVLSKREDRWNPASA
jgi:hypothetical protein